ncbi:hypothetical protein NDN08_000947 [Rhodosorus marinus]|uniref:Uncharacterized protein n=1 Tax=Rhodosorus marinus TaxID=101924 RepID=A0AAV8UPE9_9RHOD|nr:hypothetical protein NDN08_000947 [Rhodosorus marinus]
MSRREVQTLRAGSRNLLAPDVPEDCRSETFQRSKRSGRLCMPVLQFWRNETVERSLVGVIGVTRPGTQDFNSDELKRIRNSGELEHSSKSSLTPVGSAGRKHERETASVTGRVRSGEIEVGSPAHQSKLGAKSAEESGLTGSGIDRRKESIGWRSHRREPTSEHSDQRRHVTKRRRRGVGRIAATEGEGPSDLDQFRRGRFLRKRNRIAPPVASTSNRTESQTSVTRLKPGSPEQIPPNFTPRNQYRRPFNGHENDLHLRHGMVSLTPTTSSLTLRTPESDNNRCMKRSEDNAAVIIGPPSVLDATPPSVLIETCKDGSDEKNDLAGEEPVTIGPPPALDVRPIFVSVQTVKQTDRLAHSHTSKGCVPEPEAERGRRSIIRDRLRILFEHVKSAVRRHPNSNLLIETSRSPNCNHGGNVPGEISESDEESFR